MEEKTFINEYIVTQRVYRSWVMMSFLSGKNLLIHIMLLLGGVSSFALFLLQLTKPSFFYPDAPPDTVYFNVLDFALTIISFGILIYNFIFRPGHLYRKMVRRRGTLLVKYKIIFDSDLIILDTAGDTFRRPYNKISGIKEFKDRVYIGFSDDGGLWVYKDAFTTGDWDACRKRIGEKSHRTSCAGDQFF